MAQEVTAKATSTNRSRLIVRMGVLTGFTSLNGAQASWPSRVLGKTSHRLSRRQVLKTYYIVGPLPLRFLNCQDRWPARNGRARLGDAVRSHAIPPAPPESSPA